jgi:hypothetical protein
MEDLMLTHMRSLLDEHALENNFKEAAILDGKEGIEKVRKGLEAIRLAFPAILDRLSACLDEAEHYLEETEAK